MSNSRLIATARAVYSEMRLDELPWRLRRSNRFYYYLSVYPPLVAMLPATHEDIVLPPEVTNVYVHMPFCSGICTFCSYFVVPAGQDSMAIDRYINLVLKEVELAQRSTRLSPSYIYIGGGTPSLAAPSALSRLLHGLLASAPVAGDRYGTLELHPEFFRDLGRARETLAVLRSHRLQRVSLGFQFEDDALLRSTRRRHSSAFLENAMEFLQSNSMMTNIDLMYGAPGQSNESWERTLERASAVEPDSISTYFTFIGPKTPLSRQVDMGLVSLPSHENIQVQHIMGRMHLTERGFNERPSDFFSRGPNQVSKGGPLPSSRHTMPLGAGAYGFLSGAQFFNEFDLNQYEAKINEGRRPIWRAFQLSEEHNMHRDAMFSLKNSLLIDEGAMLSRYGTRWRGGMSGDILELLGLNLIEERADCLALTTKGALLAEEVCWSLRCRSLDVKSRGGRDGEVAELISKHNFAPSYEAFEV